MVTIIGAGLAGLSAALELAKRNIGCFLVSPQSSERAQSVLAEGGINAALDTMGEGDAPAEHFADTMRGGCDLADPNAAAGLTEGAPGIVRWLADLGVPFGRREDGELMLRNFGGQKKKRTAYAKSSTGKAAMSALIDAARRQEAAGLIRRLPRHTLVDLEITDGICAGAAVRDDYTEELYRCPGPVLLACGGLNGLFPGLTTGTTANTGDAAALAFSTGVEFGNLEMVQYHPTTVGVTGKSLLVSEAARGEGGRLFVTRGGAPWYFMEELFPEKGGNLAPRDVVSRESVKVCARSDCGDQVYLDLTGLSGEIWRRRLPDLREEIEHYLAIDPARTPVPVRPGIHFFMGGVLADEGHRTSLPGLYAAGECACQYHGANRLGGNSMLAALYGGRVAAEQMAAEARRVGDAPVPLGKEPEAERRARYISSRFTAELGDILRRGLPVLRSGETISAALRRADALLAEERLTEGERRRAVLGRAMLLSALERKESRGAHTRTDFPDRDDARYRKTTVAAYRDGAVSITFRALPERRAAE